MEDVKVPPSVTLARIFTWVSRLSLQNISSVIDLLKIDIIQTKK